MHTEHNEIKTLLSENPYPGRGIILGKTPDGAKAVIAYFIMGRSDNSRNRIFVVQEDGIRTQAHDPSKLEDPSLIIYAPVRALKSMTIVTNGDQTDTIYDYLKNGKTFQDALRNRTFEPDAPNFTPRISGLVLANGDYSLSILKSAGGDSSSTRRYFYEYTNPLAGQGHFIHTYDQDGDPLPSFTGEPVPVVITNDINTFTSEIWNSLNAQNKISLFTRFIDLETGNTDTRIVNKNK